MGYWNIQMVIKSEPMKIQRQIMQQSEGGWDEAKKNMGRAISGIQERWRELVVSSIVFKIGLGID